MPSGPRIAVLASGNGSNMQAIAEACTTGNIPAEIALVLANVEEAGVLKRAATLGIPHTCLPHGAFSSRGAFDQALGEKIRQADCDLVVLAGFMRILTADFVRQYCGSLLNIHPSLLPKYPGLNTHQRAIDAGDSHAGASVHFVIPELDAGPVIIQAAVAIDESDDATRLAQKVAQREHEIYPRAVRWWVEGRLELREGIAWKDGRPIDDNRLTEPTDAEGQRRNTVAS